MNFESGPHGPFEAKKTKRSLEEGEHGSKKTKKSRRGGGSEASRSATRREKNKIPPGAWVAAGVLALGGIGGVVLHDGEKSSNQPDDKNNPAFKTGERNRGVGAEMGQPLPIELSLEEVGGLVPEEAKQKLLGVLKSQIDGLLTKWSAEDRAAGLANETPVVKITVEAGMLDVGSVPEAERAKIEEVVSAAVDHSIEFINNLKLAKPNITHFFPPHDGAIKVTKLPPYDKDQSIPFVYVKRPKDIYNFSFMVTLGHHSFSDRAQMLYNNNRAGMVTRDMQFQYNENQRLIGATFKRDPVVIMVDQAQKPEDLGAFGAAETLHAQFSAFVDQRMIRDLMNSNLTKREQLDSFFGPYGRLEEAVVHAVNRIWIENYKAETGKSFSPNLLEKTTHLYPGVSTLLSKVPHTKAGANQLVEWFINDPKKIQQIIGTEISR